MQCSIQWNKMSGFRCGPNTVIWFHGVTHEWMSSIFEVFFLFWLIIMCLLSSLDDIYVRVKLLVDDVWEYEDDKRGLFSVGVDSFDWLFLKNDQFPCPWCKIVLKIKNTINEDKRESSKNRKTRFSLMNDRNIYFG